MGKKLTKLQERLTQPIQDEIVDLRTQKNYGYRAIARHIEEKYGIKVHHNSVRNFLDNQTEMMSKVLQSDVQSRELVKKRFMDITNDMRMAIKNVKDLIEKNKDDTDPQNQRIILQAVAELRKLAEFQNEVMSKFSNMNIKTEQVNIIELNMQITKVLNVMEERGYIKILKQPDDLVIS